MAKRHITRVETIAAHTLFTKYLQPSPNNEGYFRYTDDWSDAKIAKELGNDLQATSIANLRLELFGKLDNSSVVSRESDKKLSELETLVTNLLACYGELEVKYNKLLDTLSLNRVVPTNILHLKTTYKENKETANAPK